VAPAYRGLTLENANPGRPGDAKPTELPELAGLPKEDRNRWTDTRYWIEVIGSNANYCDPSRWIVSASNSTNQDPPSNAIDNYPTSRWTTGRNQDGTDYFTIDFGGLVTMTNLTLTNGNCDPNDYPKTMELYASQDGKTFESTKFASVNGTVDQTIATFAPKTMRALKLKQTGSRSNWWSIHEFDSDCTVATATTQQAVATSACAVGNTVAFKSMSAGKYISARSADNNNIDALKDTVAGDAEKFVIVDAGGGFVALKALMNSQYVAVEGGTANQPLRARSTTIGAWEKFKIEHLQTTGHVAIKANSPTLYAQANMGTANAVLQANASAVGGWEDFTCEKQ
jgi:hypothetical protein